MLNLVDRKKTNIANLFLFIINKHKLINNETMKGSLGIFKPAELWAEEANAINLISKGT